MLIDGTRCNPNSFLWFKTKQTTKNPNNHTTFQKHTFSEPRFPLGLVSAERGGLGKVPPQSPSSTHVPIPVPHGQSSNPLILLLNPSRVLRRGEMRAEGPYSVNAGLQGHILVWYKNLSKASCKWGTLSAGSKLVAVVLCFASAVLSKINPCGPLL